MGKSEIMIHLQSSPTEDMKHYIFSYLFVHIQSIYDKQEQHQCKHNFHEFWRYFEFRSFVLLLFNFQICSWLASQFILEIEGNYMITSGLVSGGYSQVGHLSSCLPVGNGFHEKPDLVARVLFLVRLWWHRCHICSNCSGLFSCCI